jgi:hypothetical protein
MSNLAFRDYASQVVGDARSQKLLWRTRQDLRQAKAFVLSHLCFLYERVVVTGERNREMRERPDH